MSCISQSPTKQADLLLVFIPLLLWAVDTRINNTSFAGNSATMMQLSLEIAGSFVICIDIIRRKR